MLAAGPGGAVPSPGLGVYVHIPFCASRCDYCAFATWTDRHALRTQYVESCIRHLASEQAGGAPVAATVFVGGGTPSQLEIGDLVALLGSVARSPGAEITVEANPEDVTPGWVGSLLEAGVTRISLGVQSLDPVVLQGLGRAHDPAAVLRAAAAIGQAGMGAYSVDLIYGGAGETDASWRATLEGVLALDPAPGHVSAYALTVEAGTPLARDPARHPSDDVQAGRYEIAEQVLGDGGLEWYEISNWARPRHECLHNCNYWAGGDYLAIGSAAHGHRAGIRWWNLRTPERYIQAISTGASAVAVRELLDAGTRETEALELALRTRWGVPDSALDLADPSLDGLVEPVNGRLVLTLRGRLLANEVAIRLRRGWPHRPEDTKRS